MESEELVAALIDLRICTRDEIRGCSEAEILALEASARVKLPGAYRAFLKAIGHGAGSFFRGTDIYISSVVELNEDADALLRENGENFRLPAGAFVFSMHQGYEFDFFVISDGEDPPVYHYTEGRGAPALKWKSFSEFLALFFKIHAGQN